jgi:hypothetical protein
MSSSCVGPGGGSGEDFGLGLGLGFGLGCGDGLGVARGELAVLRAGAGEALPASAVGDAATVGFGADDALAGADVTAAAPLDADSDGSGCTGEAAGVLVPPHAVASRIRPAPAGSTRRRRITAGCPR